MGRRQHTRLRERDDISAPGGGTAVRTAGKSLTDHVQSLQRDYGNAAVTGLVVQRAPKGRKSMAASTDIKDVIKIKDKKKGPGKKAPVEETFWPTANPKFEKIKPEDLNQITGPALQHAKADDKNTLLVATEFLEEAYLRTKARMWADILYKTYKKLNDKKRADFWLKVATRQLEPA